MSNWYEFQPTIESLQECRDRRLMQMPAISPVELEVLDQCKQSTWDGNIISKTARNSLFDKHLIIRFNGWQVVTKEGLAILDTLGRLKA